MALSLGQLSILVFILARIAGVFIQAPLFNSRSIPFGVKSGLAVWMAIVLWFVTPVSQALPNTGLAFILGLVFEAAIGFLIGFICNIIFLAIQAAGEIMDMQMGLSVATALDPVFGAVISVIGRFAFMVALVIFITADGHLFILSALHQSFVALPVGTMANFSSPALVEQLINLGNMLWLVAIKVAAPIVLLIFLSDFTFGIVSRVAPQVNVFMLGFQVKPLLGIFGFMLAMPFIVKYINELIVVMTQQMVILSQAIK